MVMVIINFTLCTISDTTITVTITSSIMVAIIIIDVAIITTITSMFMLLFIVPIDFFACQSQIQFHRPMSYGLTFFFFVNDSDTRYYSHEPQFGVHESFHPDVNLNQSTIFYH